MSRSDSAEGHRRVHIIDDLLEAILVLAALGFVVLLELTRRRICAVYQLAFILCAFCTFFIFGGIVDHHLTNEQLTLALHGVYYSSSLTMSYVYLPVLTAVGLSLAVLVQLSLCSCHCCCLLGATSVSHRHCFAARIRANMSLYTTSFVALCGAIGARLNARLRQSAINPEGGTVHWTMLRAPFFLVMAHIGSLAFVVLKIFLQHADKTFTEPAKDEPLLDRTLLTPSSSSTHSPPLLQKLPPMSLPFNKKPNRIRSPTNSSAAIAFANALATRGGQHRELQLSAIAPLDHNRHICNNNDGDVSSLISSDSDSDDDVLQPVFESKTSTTALRSRQSAYSGYSSSPPASPTSSSIASSLSTSPIAKARARAYRTGSITSESVSWSDFDDTTERFLARDYYSDRPSTASTTSTASLQGLRRRTAAATDSSMLMAYGHLPTGVALPRLIESRVQGPPEAVWIPCVDPGSGSTYYYNQQTGESRWGLV